MAEANKISTDKDLTDQVGEMAAGETTGVPQLTAVLPTVQAGEMQTATQSTLGSDPQAVTGTADITGLSAAIPTQQTPNLGQVASTTQIAPNVTDMTAAQIADARRPQVDMTQVEGTVSAGSQAVAATQELDQRATHRFFSLQRQRTSTHGNRVPPCHTMQRHRQCSRMLQRTTPDSNSMQRMSCKLKSSFLNCHHK